MDADKLRANLEQALRNMGEALSRGSAMISHTQYAWQVGKCAGYRAILAWLEDESKRLEDDDD